MEISAADLATGAFGVIGFFASGFILLSMGGTVYIVDQHAAHERVRLEMLQCVEAGHELPAQSAGGDALRMLEMSALDCTLFDRSPQGSRPTLERLKSRACRGKGATDGHADGRADFGHVSF